MPGYYGTYWVKHLNEITVIDSEFDGFWMKTAYRIPDNDCNCTEPGTPPKATVPIGRFTVRSFITSVVDGAKVAAGQPIAAQGHRLRRRHGHQGGRRLDRRRQELDAGQARPGSRQVLVPRMAAPVTLAAGPHALKVRATSNGGQTQPMTPLWNPAGYLRNVVETTRVTAA